MYRVTLVIALLFSSALFGQKTVVNYDVISVTGNEPAAQLIIDDSASYWQAIEVNPANSNSFFVKNYRNNAIYYSDNVLNQKLFNIVDSLHCMRWDLLPDTLSILNIRCNVAATEFRGRKYVACYAPQYPIPEGPWKFGGLPGLILEVISTDTFMRWTATKIDRDFKNVFSVPRLTGRKFVSWDDYVKKFRQMIDNWRKAARSNGALAEGSSASVKLDAIEIIYPEMQSGKGITF